MIGIGIIGCGNITKVRHAPEYAANHNVQIIGFFDPVMERAEEMAMQYGAKAYSSYQSMLADNNIDAVSICTSNSTHADITCEALLAGKHVLCEKPMATTIEDCERMVRFAKASGRKLIIGQNQRLIATHKKAKDLIKNGAIGRVLTFATTFGHRGPETWSVEKGSKTWYFDKNKSSFGVLADLGVHKTDLIQFLIDDNISSVFACYNTLDKRDSEGELIQVDDNAICLFQSKKGIMGTMTVSWTHYGDENNWTIINGTEGELRIYDDPNYPLIIERKDGEKMYYTIDSILSSYKQTSSGVIDCFIESILSEEPSNISGEAVLESMKVIFAAIESCKAGKMIYI